MKISTIVIYSFYFIFILTISCSSEHDDLCNVLTLNKSQISENKHIVGSLNTIPLNVKSKLSRDEELVFTKLSQNFLIDYSFLNSDYYKKHKGSILKELSTKLSSPAPLKDNTILVLVFPDFMPNNLLRMSPSESTSDATYVEGEYTLYEYGPVRLVAKYSVINTPYACTLQNASVNIIPETALISKPPVIAQRAEDDSKLVILVFTSTITYNNINYSVPAKAVQINLITGEEIPHMIY